MQKLFTILALCALVPTTTIARDTLSPSSGNGILSPSTAGAVMFSTGPTNGDVGLVTPYVGTVAIGQGVLGKINAESESTAIGNYALANLKGVQGYYQQNNYAKIGNGYHNVAVGAGAMYYADATGCAVDSGAGGFNIAVGAYALLYNTCGRFNVAIGDHTFQFLATGSQNTGIGTHVGQSLGTGSNNTLVGFGAGKIATSSTNTMLGALAGDNLTSGGNNIYIGYNVKATTATTSNEMVIGSGTNVAIKATGLNTSVPDVTISGNLFAPLVSASARIKLTPQASAPTSCNSGTKGSMAYTTATNYFCFCNGTAWQQVHSPATACVW